jgi:hypothetical protein
MEHDVCDFVVLKRLWDLSRLEHRPTADQEKEFVALKDTLERGLEKSLALEDRTRRLARYLKAA